MRSKLVEISHEIAQESAKEANELGFMAKSLLLATLPHSDPGSQTEFTRRNGNFRMTIYAPSDIGLPYGNIPRLLIVWMTTEAVITKSPALELGKSLTRFMNQLGLGRTGGKKGDITRFKEQLRRLFGCTVLCQWRNNGNEQGARIGMIKRYALWEKGGGMNESKIILTQDFFDDVVTSPVPIDLRAVRALKQSSFCLDVYFWLTHRLFNLKFPATIPWHCLQAQFGCSYPNTTRGRLNFKRKFQEQLAKIQVVYAEAIVVVDKEGLTLFPSRTHIISKN